MGNKKWAKPLLVVLERGNDPGVSVLLGCKTGTVIHNLHYDSWTCYGAWVSYGYSGDSCWPPFEGRKCLVWSGGRRVEGPCEGNVYQTCPTKTIASS